MIGAQAQAANTVPKVVKANTASRINQARAAIQARRASAKALRQAKKSTPPTPIGKAQDLLLSDFE